MMDSTLTAMLGHYLPSRGTQLQSAIAMPFTQPHIPLSTLSLPSAPSSRLTTLELHENNYKIVSYGCSLNLHEDQSIGTRRLPRYGLAAPDTSSLAEQGWVNQESVSAIQDRFVLELTRRIGTSPRDVDIPFLARKLKAEIPERDVAADKVKRKHPHAITADSFIHDIRNAKTQGTGASQRYQRDQNSSTPRLQFNAVSLKKEDDVLEDDPLLVPSWGQYVRVAWQTRRLGGQCVQIPQIPTTSSQRPSSKTATQNSIQRAGSEITNFVAQQQREHPPPPSKVLEQTIQWSTSNEILFTPHIAETKDTRRTVVSPREILEEDYLGDLPAESKTLPALLEASTLARSKAEDIKLKDTVKASGAENKALKEHQKRVMQRLRASGEDRI